MTGTHPAHPDADVLRSFGLGLLDEPDLERVSDHLSGCESCRSAVENTPPDALVEALGPADTVQARAASTVTGLYGPTPAAPDVPPELAGHPRYRVLELLGSGGMGAVYKTEHRVMERVVALKVINPRWMRDPAVVERFDREVKAAARLVHPNIVTAYDAERAGDVHFLVMEYVEGTRLDRVVEQRGPLPVREACEYAGQAARGLEHAHRRGMVHRDIKPHNLILTPDGQVKILDFGLARFVSELSLPGTLPVAPPDAAAADSLTGAGDVLGTAEYMAPEQVRDAHQADIRADVYALGCTLYHLLTGHPPFPRGRTLEKLIAQVEEAPPPLAAQRPDVPPALARAVDRMLAKDPAGRFQTPAEVVAALAPFAAPPRRRRWPAVAAALLAVAAVAAGVVIRVTTDNGELVIETDDADVQVTVLEGGKQVAVLDAKTGRTVKLRVGEYGLRLDDDKKDYELSTDRFTLRRGEKVVVKATLKPVAAAKPDEKKSDPADAATDVWFRRMDANADGVLTGDELPAALRADLGRWDANKDGRVSRDEYSDYVRNRTPVVPQPRAVAEVVPVEVRSLVGHRKQVNALTVSPDGRRVVSAGHDKVVRLWDIETGQELRWFTGHTEDLICAAFSADGSRLLTGGGGGLWKDGRTQATDFALRLWDVATGAELRHLRGHSDLVNAVRFLPDGRRAVSASTDSTLRLWDLDTGRELRVFEGHRGGVAGLGLTPDGARAVSGGFDRTVRVWDVAAGRQVVRFDEHSGAVRAVDVSPDGKRAVSVGDDRRVLLWDLEAGKLLRAFSGTAGGWGRGSATNPPGGSRSSTSGHQTLVMSAAFSPDGRRVVTGGGYAAGAKLPALHKPDDIVRVWDVATGQEVGRYTGHTNVVRAVAFAAGGRAVVSAGADKAVRVLWLAPRESAPADPPAGRGVLAVEGEATTLPVLVRRAGRLAAVLTPKDHPAAALPPGDYDLALAAGADEWRLSSATVRVKAGDRQVVKLARDPAAVRAAVPSLRELRQFTGHTTPVSWVAASPDGRTAATCSHDGIVLLWDLTTGGSRRLVGQDQPAGGLAFAPDGRRLVTGIGSRTLPDGKPAPNDFHVRLWDVAAGTEVRRFPGHTTSATAVAVSPDGKRLLTGSWDATVRLWEVETGRLIHVLSGHEWQVWGVAVAPDGRTGASASIDGTVRLWDLETGRQLRVLDGHTEWAGSVSFSPDGRRVVSGSVDRTARVWDVATGREVLRLTHPTGVNSTAFSPDGRRVLADSGAKLHPDGSATSAGYDHVVHVWDAETGREIGRFEGHTGEPHAVAFHPDGRSALSVGQDLVLRQFALPDPGYLPIAEVRSFPSPTQHVNQVAFTPDGKRVLSACVDGKVRVCDRDTGKELFALSQPEDARAMAVSPDGRYVLAGGGGVFRDGKWHFADFAVRLWDLETGREVRRLVGHEHVVQSIAFTPDGKRALTGASDNTLRLWDVETGRQVRLFTGHYQTVLAVALSPDGQYALSAGWDETVRLWEVATGRELRRMVGHVGYVPRVAFTPDGRQAISGGVDHTVRVWDLRTGQEARRLAGHATGIYGLAMSPDGRFLLTGSGVPPPGGVAGFDHVVRLWDLAAGRELARYEGHTGGAAVAFAPDGKQALSGGSDATVRLLQLPELPVAVKPTPVPDGPREMADVLTIAGHKANVGGVAVCPDGRHAVSASHDGTLRVWDLTTAREVRRLSDGEDMFLCVAVSPDGATAVAGTAMAWKGDKWEHADFAVRVFDLRTGKALHRMTGHTWRVWCVAVSPDGKSALSGADDHTVRLWDLTTGREKRVFHGHTVTPFGVAFLPDGKRAVSAAWDDTLRVWDLETGRELRRFEENGAAVTRLVLSPDGRRALTANTDRSVRLWDLDAGTLVRTYPKLPTVSFGLAFTPDGKRFLTGSGDRWDADVTGAKTTRVAGSDSCVRLFDVETGAELARGAGGGNAIRGIAVTPDGRFAVAGTEEGSIRVLRLPGPRTTPPTAGKLALTGTSPHASVVVRQEGRVVAALHPRWEPAADLPPGDYELEVAGRPDGLRLTPEKVSLKAGESRPVAVEWRPAPEPPPTLREVRRFEGHTTWVCQVAFAPDGKRFASCAWDRFVRIWDAQTGREVRKLEHPEEVWAVAWSPDGERIATAGGGLWTDGKYTLNDRSIRVWNPDDGKEVRRLTGHTAGRVNYLTYSPDGSRLLSAGDDLTARLWDVAAGKEVRAFRGHRGLVAGVAFSPDGKKALSACHDGIVRLWDLESGELVRRFDGHTGPAQGVVFLKGGARAATTGHDRTVRIWDVATGEQLRVIGPLPSSPCWVAATPRDQLLTGGGAKFWGQGVGYDNHVRLWDPETGRELARSVGQSDAPWAVSVSRDGRRAVAAGQDRVIRLFALPDE